MYSRCNNFRDFPKSLWHPHILFYITYQGVGTCSWDSYHSLIMIYSKPDMQKHSFAHGHIKKYPNLKKKTSMTVSFTILMVKQFALCKLQCLEFVHFLKGLISKNRGHQLFS